MIHERNRSVPISMRLNGNLLAMIDELADLEFNGNVTETARNLISDGLKLRRFQKTIQDNPEKSNEIIKEMNEKIENESVYDWLNNLTDRQKKGIVEYIQTTKD